MPISSNPKEVPPTGKGIWQTGTLTYTASSLTILFFWLLLGDFSWFMRERSVTPMSQWYLNQLAVPSMVFGLLISSLPAILQIIVAPWISVRSDRHRGPWGRRIPYLLWTTPIASVAMVGLALTPLLAGALHRFAASDPSAGSLASGLSSTLVGKSLNSLLQNETLVAVVLFGVFWTVFEAASIAGKPIFDGLINDVVPRSLLGRFFGLFRAISLIDGMIFNYWIMGHVPDHFTVIMLAIALFYSVAFLWMCLRVREGRYPQPVSPSSSEDPRSSRVLYNVKTYCRQCFAQPYYLLVLAFLLMANVSFVPVNVFAVPYAKHVGLSMDIYGKALALTFLVSLCLSYFLGWMADRFHPLRMAIASLVGYAILSAWGGLFARDSTSFLVSWILHGVLSGCYFTSAASLSLRLFPQERFAQFASAAATLLAVSHIFTAPVVGWLIDATGKDFRYTFRSGFILSLLTILIGIVLYRQFEKHGGPRLYKAPEVIGP